MLPSLRKAPFRWARKGELHVSFSSASTCVRAYVRVGACVRAHEELLLLRVHVERCKSLCLCVFYVILTFTLNGVCSMLVSYLYYFMVRNAGPRCSVIFAVCLPFTCVVFVPFWELLGHELGRSTSLMLSCWLCGVTPRLLKRSLLTVVWSGLGMLPEWRIAGRLRTPEEMERWCCQGLAVSWFACFLVWLGTWVQVGFA